MISHDYLFLEKIEKDGKFIHEGLGFNILIPVENNEKAVDAEKTVKIAMSEHLKKIGKQIPAYDLEYIGTKRTDDFQTKTLESKGFCIIPMESEQKNV